MNYEKKEKIREWVEKGAEWCAERLWTVQQECNRAKKSEKRHRYDRIKKVKEQEIDCTLLLKANDNLRKLLELNGIRPTRLRVTYVARSCIGCPYVKDAECRLSWDECDYGWENVVETISYYDYKIEGGYLAGITSTFENTGLSVLKVVDVNSEEVLYEEEQDEGDET